VEQCQVCAASLAADAQWCGQCYAVRPAAAAATFGGPAPGSIMSPVRAAPVKTRATPLVRTRWRKTPTTFGPFGRVLCTLGLVVPFILFVVVAVFTGGLDILGPVFWGGVIMPWGLRDVWKAGAVPAN
jgi:hypothetical protein